MRVFLPLLILVFYSCNNERIIQLPEIEGAEITEVLDVSPAYIFYDETQPDSTLLNRKNLISTTNWLVNVDKRLTLKQAIPHIKFLQDKKRNAKMHKNENAKNYFTCNDTSIKNLGFIEFTDVYYKPQTEFNSFLSKTNTEIFVLDITDKRKGTIKVQKGELSVILGGTNDFKNFSFKDKSFNPQNKHFVLFIRESISFQDYITIKSKLLNLESEEIMISSTEFIY